MATLDVYSREKKKVGSVELADAVFAVKPNLALVHQVLTAQLAERRQGTAKVKTKAEVRGGGRKPYKQKGTGNARRGSQRSPLMVGGGSTFGPKPRSYSQATPKKMVRGAICSVLSDRVSAQHFFVIDELKFDKPHTKGFITVFKKNFDVDSALVIDHSNRNLELSGRNVPRVKVLRTDQVNVYDIIKHEWLFITKEALKNLEARLVASQSAKAK
jgi:large subunit ribosomal protein L4